ncbi:MAG: hypothetical protein FWB85_11455 [Chitinispirillia bacterium]|nr:hypothetical protein [Chitinispirillia bacterium]
MAPKDLKASAFGLHAAIAGIGLLPASVIAGVLWEAYGQASPFLLGGALAMVAGVSVFFLLSMKRVPPD